MQKLKLGASGLEVSALCLGTDLFGTKRDKDTCYRLLDFYREQGGNFIDTANLYAAWLPGFQGGESESTIGQWMRDRACRNEIIIDSKLGFDFEGSPGGLNATEIEREYERSLKRLQTDRIDLYYAHRDDRDTPVEETMRAFDRLVRAGKVRALGASNLKTWRIASANTIAASEHLTPYTVVQQRYTFARPRHNADFGPQIFINDELKDFTKSSGVALIAYSVLLSGAYLKDPAQLPPQFAGPDAEERFRVLREIAVDANASVNQVIIAWMRQSDPAILPIIAASKTEQLAENIAALKVILTPEQMQKLNTAGDPQGGGWLQPS